MTTAHRPTWKAAVGRAQEGAWSSGGAASLMSSARDLAAHTKLKFRKGPQAVALGADRRSEALRESLLKMEEAEKRAESNVRRAVRMGRDQLLLSEDGEKAEEEGRMKLLKQTADVDEEEIRAKYDDEDDDGDAGGGGGGGGWSDMEDGRTGDDPRSDQSDLDASDDEDSDLDDDDDEDEEAALQAELAKIRSERAAAKAKEEAEAEEEEQAQMEEAALTGNPLLNSGSASSSTGRLKRRWNDDVVFRNQARGEPDQNKKRFINDTVRNDFHKRFLNKFIK